MRFPARAEPLWRPRRRLTAAHIPPPMRPWLFDEASLTQRVVQACAGNVRVELLRQCWRRPMRGEACALDLAPGQRALVREVHLRCADVPWVYARTVIPRASLIGFNRRLAHLQTRSLGAVLFADPSMERGEVEIAHVTPADTLYEHATAGLARKPAELWARRARYLLRGRPLLVSEIFLPPLPAFPSDRPA